MAPHKIVHSSRLFLMALLVPLFFHSCTSDTNNSIGEARPASITTATAEYRDLSHTFRASSEVVPYQRIYVASQVSGLVNEVHFEEGDRVQKGDVMARIDTRLQQNELRRAEVTLDEARDQYERSRRLFEREAISEAEYLSDRRNYELARNDVERLELLIDYGRITAPGDAVVTSRLVENGNSVSENERLFEIADLNNLVIRPGVSEMDLKGLETGQSVNIMLDVYPGHEFDGRIRRIYPDIDAESRLFTVEVQLLREDGDPVVRPGYLARIPFVTDHQESSLVVPTEAVVDRNGEDVVFVLDEGEEIVHLQTVDVGIRRDGYAQILSGLEEGDVVAAANIDALEDELPVRVVGTFRRHGFRQ
ncbi:efflux RND transporter periplasmic adaptor subunit [Balneolales bacterium ANBcel1]|nr:efflux RND transporter periplasmic adaptor subunit [Balneolales bacterium ANBcel1]